MRLKFLGMIFIILIVVVLRLPSLECPLDNDSSAIAYHGRLIRQGLPLYGVHHPGHHLPAAYYAGALAILLFGDSLWAIKVFLLLWFVLTTAVIYRLGYLWDSRHLGLLAALFFAILSSHLFLMGQTAEIELFANLPRALSILLFLHLIQAEARSWEFFFPGVIAGAAFLFKPIYISSVVIAVAILSFHDFRRKRLLHRIGWLTLGFISILGLVTCYFNAQGTFSGFVILFTLGGQYVNIRFDESVSSILNWLVSPFVGLAINNVAMLLFALLGLAFLCGILSRGQFRKDASKWVSIAIVSWFGLSYLEANVSGAAFLHYYLLLVPSLSLLAAWFLVKMYRDIKRMTAHQGSAILVIVVVLSFTIGVSVYQNLNYYTHYVLYELGLEKYEDFVRDGWPALGAIVLRVQEVADYISVHTQTTDLIYYWSSDVQLYYLSNRRCAIDIIWPIEVGATGAPQRIFSPRTKYIIVGEVTGMSRPAWLYEGLREHCVLETVIQEQVIYRCRAEKGLNVNVR